MKYIVEISVNSDTDDSEWLEKHLISSKMSGVAILHVKPARPNDHLTTISYSAEAIREHIENTTNEDNEARKLLPLVTDEQLEEFSWEVISGDYCCEDFSRNMESITQLAIKDLKAKNSNQSNTKGEPNVRTTDLQISSRIVA